MMSRPHQSHPQRAPVSWFLFMLVVLAAFKTSCVIANEATSTSTNLRGGSTAENINNKQKDNPFIHHKNKRLLLQEQHQNNEEEKNHDKSAVTIYTFFSKIDGFSEGTYDEEMLEVWKSSWKSMGWEPQVLTLEDAKRHPLFEKYNEELLTNIQLDPNVHSDQIKNNTPLATYNQLCYLRWLAMAASGGGWMADYDTVPLTRPQPDDDSPSQFTLHHSGGVPALISGSAQEWERLALALLEEGKNSNQNEFKSDMMSLMHLVRHQPNNFDCLIRNEVVGSNTVLFDDMSDDFCGSLADKRAVHFSHHSTFLAQQDKRTYGYKIQERPLIMKTWVNKHNETCPQ